MLSQLTYEPFLVMVSNHDAEWSRQDYGTDDTWQKKYVKEADRIRDDCQSWAKGIQDNHEKFREANGLGKEVPPGEQLPAHFYDPIFYLPLGHSDLVSFILLDDVEPVHHFSARMRTTLENTSIAFAPQLQSLGITPDNKTFLDLPQIWALKNAERNGLPPMLLFCRLKMDGLASLGLGLKVQIATWQALVARTNKIVSTLTSQARSDPERKHQNVISLEDVQTMRCALLDLQGCEEIGLLIFCRNLSVACSVVAGARALTYQDAFNADPDLLTQLNQSEIHQSLIRYAKNQGIVQGEVSATALSNNHLFKWSDSALGVRLSWPRPGTSTSLLPEGEITGMVQAVTRFQIAPGHFAEMGNLVSVPQPANQEESGPGKDRHYLVGLYDNALQHRGPGFGYPSAPMLKMDAVVHNLDAMLQKLCLPPTDPGNPNNPANPVQKGRNIVDFETDLIVPVPRLSDENKHPLYCEAIGDKHFSPLLLILPKMISQICYASDKKDGSKGALDIATLIVALRRLGVPVQLRRTIEYLFRNFAIVTADPFSFDVLLDLYDTLSTLHAGFTQGNPTNLGYCESTDEQSPRKLLDEGKVRNLAKLAEALHNSMVHRTANAFRGAVWRDMAVDFRGGLNQILFATDAPLKCGLGVVRRFASRRRKTGPEVRPSKNGVGCVIQIGMTPGVRCHSMVLGIESRARLAFFDADVPHILHVASYADYLHEACHLVFQAVMADKGKFWSVVNSMDKPDQEEMEEVFALALWRLFLFGSDKKAFAYHWILSFSRDMLSVGKGDANTWRRFVEVLIQIFLATECWEDREGDPRFWPEQKKMRFQEVEDRFMKFAAEVGPFFSEFERLWAQTPQAPFLNSLVSQFRRLWSQDPTQPAWMFTEFARTGFRNVYARTMGDLPIIWDETLRIYKDTVSETFPEENPETLSDKVTSIKKTVDDGLNKGRPLIWSQYGRELLSTDSSRSNQAGKGYNFTGGGLDPLQFVCRILYCYIRGVTSAEGKRIHLLRDAASGNLRYEGHTNWWEFQSDKGAAALFCCIPSSRQRRLRKQIVVIKSFWDLASELRARRLLEMLQLAQLHEGA